jgi:hypothetical protein
MKPVKGSFIYPEIFVVAVVVAAAVVVVVTLKHYKA